jgi:uncharacterized protein (DUF362 family)
MPDASRVPPRSPVGLYAAPDYGANFSDVIGRGLAELGVDVRGKAILLKPNLVEYESGTVINTNPAVVAGAATALLRAGARRVSIGEGPAARRDLEYLLTATGLLDVMGDLRLEFTDLNNDDVRAVRLASRLSKLEELYLPVSVLDTDLLVSMPKLKIHHWAGLTCGLKNLFGCVPGAVYGWPKNLLHFAGIDESIVDLAATLRPGLTIVDGVDCMEGDGPLMGQGRRLGLIGMGTDAAAVDATCARLIGFVPDRIPYLEKASRFLGNIDELRIEQRGESPGRYATRFRVPKRLRGLLREDA